MVTWRMATAAILAGGRARRFGGRAKALLPVGGRKIIDRLLAVLRPIADEVLIVANDSGPYSRFGVPVRADRLRESGPLGGVHAALTGSGSPHTLVVAGDMPFLNGPFLEHLLRAGQSADVDVAVPRTGDGPHPLCACYRVSCAAAIERRIAAGALKVSDVLDDVRTRELPAREIAAFDPDGVLLFNVNTPADHARALALAAYRGD